MFIDIAYRLSKELPSCDRCPGELIATMHYGGHEWGHKRPTGGRTNERTDQSTFAATGLCSAIRREIKSSTVTPSASAANVGTMR